MLIFYHESMCAPLSCLWHLNLFCFFFPVGTSISIKEAKKRSILLGVRKNIENRLQGLAYSNIASYSLFEYSLS